VVLANAADLRRVFANLIINAIDVMPQGGTLTLEAFAQNGIVFASVSDTGVGIAPEQQKKIFLPYYTTKSKGTGLGLSGAQRIVQSFGGNIGFITEVGRGTKFTIELPAAERRQESSGQDVKAA
jgi:signal transduction histidine kinase